MNMKLVTGEEYDAVTVEYTIVMQMDNGWTDAQILAQFDESSKEEVKKRIIAFRK